MYQDYKLEKYKPWDSSFNFYAYRWYNSLTINDSNLYKFDFYDADSKLIFSNIFPNILILISILYIHHIF